MGLKVAEKLDDIVNENTQKKIGALKQKLKSFPKCWQNWILRAIFSIILIGYFCFTIYTGPIAIILSTLIIQIQCYSEIINIAYTFNKLPCLPLFRLTSWYFLICINYFLYGEMGMEYFNVFIEDFDSLKILFTYHRFISFCFYFAGVMWFILNSMQKYGLQQNSLFIWIHFALVIIVIQSYMIIKNIFQGLVWLIVPVTMVVCNDITAYLFGFFFGRTSLIKLSPKKTWEGFMGGIVCTIIYGCIISHILCQYKYFTCPIEYVKFSDGIKMITECKPSNLFQHYNYHLEIVINEFLCFHKTLTIYPFVLHSLSLSLFSSIIGPFGGFFASGLKRACRVKDFSNIIPGHGGIMDRFDCQYLMATFVNVYITTFVETISTEKIFARISNLPNIQQLEFYYLLQEMLKDKNSSIEFNNFIY